MGPSISRAVGSAPWRRYLAVPAGLLLILTVASPSPPNHLRVLVLSGRNNHAWQETTPALKDVYEASGRFSVDVLDDPARCDIARLGSYDVLVSNWTNFPSRDREWGPALESAVLDFVRSGKGFVLFHAAGATFPDWPEYLELTGASWGKDSGHGSYHAFNISIVDKAHPVTLLTGDFVMTDELWHRLVIQPSAHVLCEAFSDASHGGTGRREPVALTTAFGGGRVFYLVLGHDAQAMTDPNWKLLMLRGTEWAARGEATIEIPGDIGAILQPGTNYACGRSRDQLAAIERLTASTSRNPALRKELAARMAGLLASDAAPDFKAFLCGQISLIGSAAEVPQLVKMLGDEGLGFHARAALERMPGEECSRALRDSLPALAGTPLIGAINTLGERRDAGAVPLLSRYLEAQEDKETLAAAVQALGAIGGREAASTLSRLEKRSSVALRPLVADSLLRCAGHFEAEGAAREASAIYSGLTKSMWPALVRDAGFVGCVRCVQDKDKGGRLILDALGGGDETLQAAAIRALTEQNRGDLAGRAAAFLPGLAGPLQPRLIYTLAGLGDPGTMAVIEPALSSPGPEVRLAAIFATGRLGGRSSVGALCGLISGADRAELVAIRESLARLQGAAVDEELIASLSRPGDAAARRELMTALSARDCRRATPIILRAARDNDGTVRQAAIKALGSLGEPGICAELISLLSDTTFDGEKPAIEAALVSIAKRAASTDVVCDMILGALVDCPPEATPSLLRVLGRLGGEAALRSVRLRLDDAAPDVRAAAIEALSSWPDSSALADLLSVAGAAKEAGPKILALRGAAGLIDKASDLTDDEKAAALERALRAADDPDSLKLLLGTLGKVPTRAALSMAMPFIHRGQVADEARLAVAAISRAIGKEHPEGTRPAVLFALRGAETPTVVEQLDLALAELGAAPRPGKIRAAVVTGGHDFDQAPFFRMFEALADTEFVHLPQADESEVFEDITDWPYDVIVLYGMPQKISPKRRENFSRLLDGGVGLLALHHASGAFQDWPEYARIIGCRYDLGGPGPGRRGVRPSAFLHDVDFQVRVADPTHPVARGLADFSVHDETYKYCRFEPGARVLLSTAEPTSDTALCVANTYHRAHVVYLQPGHGPGIFSLEAYRRLIGQAVRWCAAPRLEAGGQEK